MDLRYIGEQFTWSNRRYNREDFSQRKLDRALVNQEWLDKFSDSFAHFQALGISDHSPIVVHVKSTPKKKEGLLNSTTFGLLLILILI